MDHMLGCASLVPYSGMHSSLTEPDRRAITGHRDRRCLDEEIRGIRINRGIF